MMTRQEMFNKAWHGVIAQGGPSNNKAGSGCAYRGEGGRKCGVGHLIDDETARKWDKARFSAIDRRSARSLQTAGLSVEDKGFLECLQIAHDDAGYDADYFDSAPFVARFKANMRGVAERFNLTVPDASA